VKQIAYRTTYGLYVETDRNKRNVHYRVCASSGPFAGAWAKGWCSLDAWARTIVAQAEVVNA
jgi:hypothetical protein